MTLVVRSFCRSTRSPRAPLRGAPPRETAAYAKSALVHAHPVLGTTNRAARHYTRHKLHYDQNSLRADGAQSSAPAWAQSQATSVRVSLCRGRRRGNRRFCRCHHDALATQTLDDDVGSLGAAFIDGLLALALSTGSPAVMAWAEEPPSTAIHEEPVVTPDNSTVRAPETPHETATPVNPSPVDAGQ